MHSGVKLRLDNNGIFHGSENLTGQVQLRLKGPAVASYVKIEVDSDLYVEAYLPNVYPSPLNRKIVQKCLYYQRHTVFDDPRELESGMQSIDFSVPLPIDSLPSSQDMLAQFNQGCVTYTVKVKLRLKEKTTGCDEKEIGDQCEFTYVPHQNVGDYDMPQPQLVHYPFREGLQEKTTFKSIKGGWSSVKQALGSIPNPQIEREELYNQTIECVFGCPELGMRQDIDNKFDLVIHPTQPQITLTRLKLGLNEYASVKIQKYGDSRLVTCYDLLDRTLSHTGSTIDVGPMLMKVKLPPKLVPSFEDPNYRKFYRLKLTLYFHWQGSPGGPGEQRATAKHEFNIPVLSSSVSQTMPQYQENLDLPVPAYTEAPPAYGVEDDAPMYVSDGAAAF